jgi:4-hydroxybenzoate polyprenyltransferase
VAVGGLAGLAMTFLQLGIGTTNDIVDAPFDAGRKAGKPIPTGLVGRSRAVWLAVLFFAGGIALSASLGTAIVVLSLVVIAIGLAYDLRLKGTAWSWLPFACGIPVLPVFGWLAGAGRLEPAFGVLLPAAVASGAALAIGNSLVDVERDRAAGRTSVAGALGERLAVRVEGLLFVAVGVAATWSLMAWRPGPLVLAVVAAAVVPVLGTVVSARGRTSREGAWRLEAVGVALLGALWTAAVLV